MFTQQKRLLNYWRASIKNEHIIGTKIKDNQYKDYFLPKSCLTTQGIEPQQAKKLFASNKKSLIPLSFKTKNATNKIFVLPIVIAVRVYKKMHEHGEYQNVYKKPYIHPIWIYAYLGEQGDIFTDYPCMLPPWVARDYLEPSYQQEESIIIGSIAKYDDFLDRNNINTLQPHKMEEERYYILWQDLREYAEKALKHVALGLEECLAENGYFNQEMQQILIVPINENKNYSANLLKLLDNLQSKTAFKPLFAQYLSPGTAASKPVLTIEQQLQVAAGKHLGQMTGDFPLSHSQRVALHHVLLTPEGKMLAINGPPGTGKTTLLGSIIASLWIDAIIKKEPPPIIVVSSTNNKAIQNVIDSLENRPLFTNNNKSVLEEYLAKRWIDGVTSFGLYLINTPPTAAYHYYSDSSKSGSLQAIENGNHVHIKNYYLKNFNKCFGITIFSVPEAENILYNKIIILQNALQAILNLAVEYNKLNKKHQKYSKKVELTERINALKINLANCKISLDQVTNIKIAWDYYLTKLIWHRISLKLLPFLTSVLKNIISYKIQEFLLHHKIDVNPDLSIVSNYLTQKINYYRLRTKRIKFLIDQYQQHLNNINNIKTQLHNWQKKQQITDLNIDSLFNFSSVDHVDTNKEQNLLIFLDTKIRFMLFQYAVHYWEAKWIIETMRHDNSNQQHQFDRQSRLNRYKHMAMLTPCFITTMHSGPAFFTFKITNDQKPEFMLNSIDLLIIDEASQVHPGYGAGMIALSKKACVVGDILQLPPVINIPGSVDIGNMQYYELITQYDEYNEISKYGVNIASCAANGVGSVMKIAKNVSFFQEQLPVINLQDSGIFLTEHRRCVPEIISYCNECFYNNKMSYHRSSNKNRPFMPLGYAHISGLEKSSGASKVNHVEAMSIVKWILDKKTLFLKIYPGKTLDQIFGIITPFNAQADLIRRLVKKQGISLDQKNNIGTIHTFQGGEFPVIIFSTVYSYDHANKARTLFFDTEYTMLNVAVSRARDHFFLFGDMEIFDPSIIRKPSKLLINYLLADPKNELLDVKTMREFYVDNYNISIKHINSLEDHRNVLKKAFYIAKKRVVIVSPWITYNAIKADNIQLLIQAAVAKKISIIIYTDNEKNTCTESIKMLQHAGAVVKQVKNIHAKTLLVDNQLFIEGSFNWLSASRSNPNYEASICCEGTNLQTIINAFMKRLENREVFALAHNTIVS